MIRISKEIRSAVANIKIYNSINRTRYLDAIGFPEDNRPGHEADLIRDFNRVGVELKNCFENKGYPLILETPWHWKVWIVWCCWWQCLIVWFLIRKYKRRFRAQADEGLHDMMREEGQPPKEIKWKRFPDD